MLVGLGACLFSVVSAYSFGTVVAAEPGVVVRYDPTRIAAQIVTGIGFLGAGAIMQSRGSVEGVTTLPRTPLVLAAGRSMPRLALQVGLIVWHASTLGCGLLNVLEDRVQAP